MKIEVSEVELNAVLKTLVELKKAYYDSFREEEKAKCVAVAAKK